MAAGRALLIVLSAAAGLAQAQTVEPAVPPAAPSRFTGAIGITGAFRSAPVSGASPGLKALPAFYLRYGRFSTSNTGALSTRSSDDVVQGLGAELLQGDKVQASASLRYDPGIKQSARGDLAGLGGIKATVRTRLALSWQPARAWRLGATYNVDAFSRGQGNLGDISAGWDHRVAPHTALNLGASLSFADRRYTRSHDGVNPQQSANTGLPVYTPGEGVRDSALFGTLRHELSPDWVALAGVYVRRLQGPAAASPQSRNRNRNREGITGTLAWRF